jgi:hypothetical protein
VSAVLPFFNHGMFVREAIDSIRAQTRPVDQIVIVDDGSTDPQSLAVLDALAATDVSVVRQTNRGPGAARNTGVQHSDGDAIFFLDSDDLVTDRHVESALRSLAGAPEEVGFVYPDMQFYGNERDLVVMPPYNLYLLLNRNFCCMGGLIDRAVFDAGNQFRADLRHGHEDWDFFITLGEHGVFGRPFHGSPLLYRRWGYSRSDGVKEKGTFLREVRDLHPELNDSRRLIGIKREWAPALSVAVPEGLDLAVTRQTCDDFEVVPRSGAEAPALRGRWVLVLEDAGSHVLEDPTFVERVLRLAAARPTPLALTVRAAMHPGCGWRRADGRDKGVPLGLVVEGATYTNWRESSGSDMAGFPLLYNHLASVGGGGEEWDYGGAPPGWGDGRGTGLTPLAAPRPPPGEAEIGLAPGADPALATRGAEFERAFRQLEAKPLFIPDGGYRRLPEPPGTFRDGLEAVTERAWSDWMPPRSARLHLVVDEWGQGTLAAADRGGLGRANPEGPDRLFVGWIWAQPFPGTTALYEWFDLKTHSVAYRVSDEPPRDSSEVALGYVAKEPLPGRIELLQALEAAGGAARGQARVRLPVIEGAHAGLYVERASARSPDTAGTPARPHLGSRRWPLYEVALTGGMFRYSCNPDAPMGWDAAARPFALAVAAIGDAAPGRPLSMLCEAMLADGGLGYVSGTEMSTAGATVTPLHNLGSLSGPNPAEAPLVRLHPAKARPEGSMGHRLAIDWQPLMSDGYVTEGVVGYATRVDGSEGPLYRWWDATKKTWQISLGEDARRRLDYLEFRGTLGTAYEPGTPGTELVDLFEMRRGRTIAYATATEPLTSRGFGAGRVIARILREYAPGSVPLLAMSSEDEKRWLLTTCSREGVQAGLTRADAVGFIGAAVPAPVMDEIASAVPDWAVLVDERDGRGNVLRGYVLRDPVPGAVPLWCLRRADGLRVSVGDAPGAGAERLGFVLGGITPFSHPVFAVGPAGDPGSLVTSELSVAGGEPVRDVVCFLPGPLSIAPDQSAGGGRSLRAMAKSMATAPLVRRLGITRHVPPVLRRSFRRFVR